MRVHIVEHNACLLRNLSILLAGESGIEVAGAFVNAEDAVATTSLDAADILSTDTELPGMSGVEPQPTLLEQHNGAQARALRSATHVGRLREFRRHQWTS